MSRRPLAILTNVRVDGISVNISDISNSLSNETSRAISMETSLSSGLSSESSRVISMETSVSSGLSSESSRAISMETSLSSGLSSESSRAISMETSLSSGLSTESSRAISMETSLSSGLSTESSRAISMETYLSNNILTAISAVLDNVPSTMDTLSSVVDLSTTQTITGVKTFSNNVIASSFVKSGGTVNEFLKANGTVDNTQYYKSPTLVEAVTTGNTGDLAFNDQYLYVCIGPNTWKRLEFIL